GFFFSSRRRHTRSKRDWSSDVCSSDLRVGLPKNVLQVLSGRGRVVGQKLITDERVQMISFTGGRSTGEDVIKMAGLKKASMELRSEERRVGKECRSQRTR